MASRSLARRGTWFLQFVYFKWRGIMSEIIWKCRNECSAWVKSSGVLSSRIRCCHFMPQSRISSCSTFVEQCCDPHLAALSFFAHHRDDSIKGDREIKSFAASREVKPLCPNCHKYRSTVFKVAIMAIQDEKPMPWNSAFLLKAYSVPSWLRGIPRDSE